MSFPAPGTYTLLDAATSTGASAAVQLRDKAYTFQANVAGTGAVAATVLVYVSSQDVEAADDVTLWTLAATLSLSGTNAASASAVKSKDAPWKWAYVDATALTGTGAALTVSLGSGA